MLNGIEKEAQRRGVKNSARDVTKLRVGGINHGKRLSPGAIKSPLTEHMPDWGSILGTSMRVQYWSYVTANHAHCEELRVIKQRSTNSTIVPPE